MTIRPSTLASSYLTGLKGVSKIPHYELGKVRHFPQRSRFDTPSALRTIGVLIIGGTGFTGPHVVRQLLASGVEVAVLHRGQTPHILPEELKQIRGDCPDRRVPS